MFSEKKIDGIISFQAECSLGITLPFDIFEFEMSSIIFSLSTKLANDNSSFNVKIDENGSPSLKM